MTRRNGNILVSGNCTDATVANALIGVAKAAYNIDVVVTTQDALNLYAKTTEPPFDPTAPLVDGENPTDNGAVLENVLTYVLKNGFLNHHMIGYVSVQPGNTVNVKQGIDKFGAISLGIQLPLAWQQTESWTLDGYSAGNSQWVPNSWGGHAIAVQKYNSAGVWVWSWGKLIFLSWDAFGLYVDEVDALMFASWIRDGNSPSGDNIVRLEAYMQSLRAG